MANKVRIRRAMLQDIASFRTLWQGFMEQQHEEGSLQLPNEYNLDLYTNLFKAYLSGEATGLVLFVTDGTKDVGVYMDGVIVGGFELSIGTYTMMWGTYLEPEYRGRGITHQIGDAAMKWTLEKGFTGGITGILAGGKTVPEVLKHAVDGKRGTGTTKPYVIELYWEFDKPSDS